MNDIKLQEYIEIQEEILQDCRGIPPDEKCPECGGWGVKAYGSTATWQRGVIGGQMITNDICDHCWGSGNKYHPWLNLRELYQKDNID